MSKEEYTKYKWSEEAERCYNIGCNCSICKTRELFSGECHMKYVVPDLLKQYGLPDGLKKHHKKVKDFDDFTEIKLTEKIKSKNSKSYVDIKQTKKVKLSKGQRVICSYLHLSNAKIAEKLDTTEECIRVQISQIYKKLGISTNKDINSRSMLLIKAIRLGLINVYNLEIE